MTDKFTTIQMLIELDFDAIKAYDSAIGGVDDADCLAQLHRFRSDHQRHTDNLGAILDNYRQDVPDGPDVRRIVTQGKVLIADLLGSEIHILQALADNVAVLEQAYTDASECDDLDAATQQTLQANLDDLARHKEWLAARIGRISSATSCA